jgi:dUTP pyrophosphatase
MFKLKAKRLHPDAKLPTRAHTTDLGMDLYSIEDKVLAPGEKYNFHLGFAASLPQRARLEIADEWNKYPECYEAQLVDIGIGAFIMDKSSVGNKEVTKLAGVVEGGYRSEWIAILKNIGSQPVEFKKGQKLCQVVIMPVFLCESEWVDDLDDTERSTGGFGSTGTH